MYIFSPPKQVHVHVAAVIIVINKDVIIIFGNFVFYELKYNTSSNKF